MKKKKIIVTIAILAILAILLVPVKLEYKDGGSIEYKALLYSVTKHHVMYEDTYFENTEVKIFGFTVYENPTFEEFKEEYQKSKSAE